jgi:FlaA1/EpsC-like NDP-sugar epimerase
MNNSIFDNARILITGGTGSWGQTLTRLMLEKRTIDSFDLNNVSLIKIDVEGMELKVLSGAVDTLQRCQPVVLFEHHKTDRTKAENLLQEVGYRIVNGIGQMTCAVAKK